MTTWRRSILIGLLIAAIVTLSGCGQQSGLRYKKYGSAGLKKIGIVLGSPGKCDPATNDAVTAGVKEAANYFNLDYEILAPKDLVNDQESLSYLAENNYDMVIAVGAGMTDALANAAPEYQDIKFVMFDGEVDEPNVTSVKIQEDDGAFLAGVEAALLTKTNLVGYIGDPITTVTSIENSFVRGVQYVNSTEGKQIKVNVSYTGVTDKAAKVAELAKTLADNFYMSGVDVIFSANRNINRGVANSAMQKRKISICNDIQLMNSAPWTVYGAVEKKEYAVVYSLARQMAAGKLPAGRQPFGLAQEAVNFIPSTAVPIDVVDKIAGVKARLKTGQVKPYGIAIPDGMVIRVKLNSPAAPGANTGNSGTPQPGGTAPNGAQPGGQSQQANTGQAGPQTGSSTGNNAGSSTGNNTGSSTGNNTGNSTGNNTSNSTGTGTSTSTNNSRLNAGTGQQ